jgi:hypothetical protein
MKFRLAALGMLGVVAVTAGVASAIAVSSSLTVTSGKTKVSYRQVFLEVPKGWAVTMQQTCASQSTKLVLYTPAVGMRRDTISVTEVVHKHPASCHVPPRFVMVRVNRWRAVIHGLRVTGLEGAGFFNGTVSALALRISGTGPDVGKVIRTLHRT